MFKTFIATCTLVAMAEATQAQSVEPPAMDHATMDHAAHMKMMADMQTQTERQTDVSNRGKDVMPFSLAATVHIFTKTKEGGAQKVVARRDTDAAQTLLVRQHLREVQAQFLKGDFSGPAHIHGQTMPGLAELEAAKPDQVKIDYKEVPGGAQLNYSTTDALLVAALHKWFDAQLADHGKDAMAGHTH